MSVVPCFVSGTRIATDRGEIPVEALRIGDRVVTMSRGNRPIKWIGRRAYAEPFVHGNKTVLPICVRAGALSEGVPRRDLWISPLHALYLEGVLIEAKDLINGTTIVQPERTAAIEYFHIELDTHDVIVSDGAFSETYLDCNNRSMFHNAHEYPGLIASAGPMARGRIGFCAPRVGGGKQFDRARRQIALRAASSAIAASAAVLASVSFTVEGRPAA